MQEKNEFLDNIDDYSDATDTKDNSDFENNPTDSPPSLDDTEEGSETVDDKDNEPNDNEDYSVEDTQSYEESDNYTEAEGANEESDGSNEESNHVEADNTTADDESNSAENDNEGNSSSSEDEREGSESSSNYRDDENAETESNDEEEANNESSTAVTAKNKKARRTIAAVIAFVFVVLLAILGYFVFFNKNVTGAWRIEDTNSDIISVLILNQDGSAKFTTGSFAVSGTYKLNSNDVMTLNISTDEGSVFKGDYTCRVSSGFMDRTMELISSSSGKVRKCKQYELKELIHPVNNFTPKAELLGKWSNSSSGYSYEFKDNGIVIVSKGNTTVTLTYFVDDTSIKLMQYFYKDTAEDDTAMDKVSYTLKDGNLIVGGLTLKKV